jgi:RNA polymerase sigma-70 factor (ECF subfamily)
MDLLEIHDKYYDRVRKFILASVREPSIADDLAQETFIRVGENLNGLRDPAKISSWIFRIAHHQVQDHFRANKKSPREEIHEGLVNLEETPIQKKVEQGEMSQCVQDQLHLLPDSHRTVLILADVMECSLQEISDILGITVENVKVRLHRARKKFKAILEEKCTFEIDERSVLVCEPAVMKERK